MYRSLERYSAQASFAWPRVDLARPLRRDDFRPFWIISFEFVKVCWIHFSGWESSLVSISYAKSYFYTILACLFTVEVWISWIRCVGKGAIARMWRPRCHLVSPTLCISIYILSDLGNLSNLIGSLSRTIQQYSPPSEWIMCELIVFPIFLSKVDKILRLTFFKARKDLEGFKTALFHLL